MSRTANQIRTDFIEFFKGKGHTFVRSAPVVPQDDPTLLFTNAGMNQFKAIFLGESRDGLKRAANSQKCMRVSGKHNDLEEVGRDHYHHTFFEMLGNWSFADYYKKEAIGWAWELLTGVWGLPKDKLYATVYRKDDESFELWKTLTDVSPDHIGRYDEKSNFWEMGETGPCGPCSEIHMDLGTGVCRHEKKPGHTCGVNVDGCARYIELWNLVFMQYNRQKDGSLQDLPGKHVDTGMGFERIVRVIQGKSSNYDIDVFAPIIAAVEKKCGKTYRPDDSGTPFRVIADHIRSLVFSITDGAFPSNEGRGYVVRRLLRRAYRFGRELGFTGPFLHELVPVVVQVMGDAFPEIGQRLEYITDVIKSEEERFGQTLEQGIERFNQMVEECRAKGGNKLAGEGVFLLYDTFGFPMDLTRLMAQEQSLDIDEAGFDAAMAQQRQRGRDAAGKDDGSGLTPDGWTDVRASAGTEFIGYKDEKGECSVTRYKNVGENRWLLCLDRTPFYAESGGQMGDTGVLVTKSGNELRVEATFKWNDWMIHRVAAQGVFKPEDFGKPLVAQINSADRTATRRNHSATHLLQAALRKVLGTHVQQSGSRVDGAGLRFDFTHFKGVSADELDAIEQQVNEWIMEDLPVVTDVKSTDQAKAEGAMALFGEKYGDTVRVVSMGGISKELCGGTHVGATGRIGLLHIMTESSISAGVRRIEALTGGPALRYLVAGETEIARLASLLKVKGDKVHERVSGLLDTVRELEARVSRLGAIEAAAQVASLLSDASVSGGSFGWTVRKLDKADKESFAALSDAVSDELKKQSGLNMVVVLGAAIDGKVLFSAAASQQTIKKHGAHCGELVSMAAKLAGGGGGGSPVRAQAGGKDPQKLDEALGAVATALRTKSGAV